AFDGVGEIEVDAAAARTDTLPFVAHFFGAAGGDIPRREIAEARVLALKVVVALVLRNLIGTARVAALLRNPDASVVAQRLRHQRQLRLKIATLRNACGMDLCVAGIREVCPAAIRAPDG